MCDDIFRLAFRNLYERMPELALAGYSDELVANVKDMMLKAILDVEPIQEALSESYDPHESD